MPPGRARCCRAAAAPLPRRCCDSMARPSAQRGLPAHEGKVFTFTVIADGTAEIRYATPGHCLPA
eukprot:2909100-Prymnesium_polylepis.1